MLERSAGSQSCPCALVDPLVKFSVRCCFALTLGGNQLLEPETERGNNPMRQASTVINQGSYNHSNHKGQVSSIWPHWHGQN